MKLQPLKLRNSLLLFAVILALPAVRTAAQNKPESAASAQANQSKAQPGLKPLARAKEDLERAQEGPEFLRRRQDWFFQPRAFPIGFIPQGARERALQQKMQMLQNESRLNLLLPPPIGLVAPGPTTSAWQAIGPQATSSIFDAPFTSGRVTALAVNPNNANNVYLGGADGGLWVTTDGGANWTPLTDFQTVAGVASIAVGALAVDPSSCTSGTTGICTTVYVGTGEDNFAGDNIYGDGVLKCTVTAGTPPTASCTQDSTFHTPSPLDNARGGPLIGALAVNPQTSGATAILLAGVRGRGTALQSGIYCSGNAGSMWTPVFGIPGIVGTDAVFASDGTAFVALGFPSSLNGANANNGIYKSSVPISSCAAVTDAPNTTPGGTGSKWIKQSLPPSTPAASLGRIALAILPSATSTATNATVYAAIADATTTSSNLLGVFKTANGGTSWTQLSNTPAFCNAQCFYDIPIAVDPSDATGNTVFAGGAAQHTLIRSTDGGNTWTEISRNDVQNATDTIHFDMHAIAFDKTGATMYVGNDGGVWKTTTPTGAPIAGFWSNLNAQLNITQFYPGISIHPSTPLSGLGGTQDNDLQQYQGPSLVWQSQEIGCDGGFTAIDPVNPSTIYGECEYLPGRAFFPIIVVAFDGQQLGNTGFLANAGINNADRGSFIPPLVMDQKNPQTLYFGTCRVWQSQDGALSWSTISPDATSPAHAADCSSQAGGTLSTIAVAPSNSKVIYVGSDDGDVEVTSNGGGGWTSIATTTLPARAVTQVAVDASSPAGDIAYVTFSGFGTCNNAAVVCDGKGHVFKTTNGTTPAPTWADISKAPLSTTPLPDIPVNAIVIDPDDIFHNTLYVGTDIGAFFTTDGGMTWSPLGTPNSLPPAEILGLALHEPSRTLRAATHGRGVWDLNLGGQAAFGITSISPFSANAGAASIANFTVNGNGFTANSVVKFTAGGTATSLTTACPNANTCTATIPMAQLANGASAQVTVTNAAQTTNAVPFTILNPVPGITTISPTSVTAGANGLSLTVNGSNFLSGANGTLVLFNLIPLPASTVTVQSSTVLTVQVPASNLTTPQAISVDTFNPQPGGGPDTNPTPPTLTVNAAPFTVSSSNVTVTTMAGAAGTTSSGTSTITLSAAQSTAVSVTCPAGTPGLTCSALTIPAGSTSGILTVNVLNPSSSMSAMVMPTERKLYAPGMIPSSSGWWTLSAGTGFAAIVLLLLPGRKRWRTAVGLGLVCVVTFTLGCGGSYGGGGGGGMGTTTTKMSVSSTKVASGTNIAFTVTVTSTGSIAPTGQVQVLDGTTVVGSATVSSGSATVSSSTLAVGTHTITAHYMGDAYNSTSQSGPLNVTVTGTTTFVIQAMPAASNGTPTVNITIN